MKALGRAPFVGRQRELSLLAAHREAARAGTAGVVVITGESGVGKTRLVEELAARAAERRVAVYWGRCHEGPGAPAYWPWRQILRALLADHRPAALRAAAGPNAGIAFCLLRLSDPERRPHQLSRDGFRLRI